MCGKRIAVWMLTGLLAAAPALAGCIGDSSADMEEYKMLGITQLEEGDFSGAAATFQDALDLSVGTFGALELDISYYKALALYLAGDADASIDVFSALLNFDEDNWEAYYLRGTILLREGQDAAALSDYADASSLNEKDAQLCLRICANLVDAGLSEEARPYLENALTRQPSTADDYYDLGRIYYQLDEVEDAEQYLQQAQEMGQEDAILLLADLAAQEGDSERAVSLFTEYLTLHPDDPSALARLGESALSAGAYDEAASYLSRAREVADDEALGTIVTNLVAAYEYAGDFQSACEAAGSYLADHSDEALEREYDFLRTRIGENAGDETG